MKSAHWIVGVSLVATVMVVPAVFAGGPGLGFLSRDWERQRKAEAVALAVPSPDKVSGWLRVLTEEPHIAGTPADRRTAEYVRDLLNGWGWDAELAEFEVLLNLPAEEPLLEIVRPQAQKLKVREDWFVSDKDSGAADFGPAFHGYSASGDVTGQVVYVNYGKPEDFKALEDKGIEVRGKIVLARYGGLFRGLKVLEAQRRGAIGILIYSDPADDGYARGDVYPNGPFRPPSAIQRGSVHFLSLGPGDPTTPGWASVPGAKRLPIDRAHGFPLPGGLAELDASGKPTRVFTAADVAAWERETGRSRAETFATIPSLPISYEAATPILAALAGPEVPEGWQGGLPMAYHIGPGLVEVHLKTSQRYDMKPVWNVVATLEGSVEPDRWVLLSNHRDAWTYGAVDPSSGTAATLEACRAMGEAVKQGWQPRRSIIYCSWDAEEYGLVGSTEWAEANAQELSEKAVMMLNVDSAVGGFELDIDGIPSLRDLILEAADEVSDPRTGKPVGQLWREKKKKEWASGPVFLDPDRWKAGAPVREPVEESFEPQLNPLGSGSDYTAFVDHLGVPAIDIGFGGRYGVYHSSYDNYFWMERFGDPGFAYHAAAARLFALMTMRAAGADFVPMRFAPYAACLEAHVDDLRRSVARKARSKPAEALEFTGLESLIASVRGFREQAERLDGALDALAAGDALPQRERLGQINDAVQAVERAFLDDAGLPGRDYYKHAIYAPGLTTGYASWPLPGVRQAIEENQPAMLVEQGRRVVRRIEAATRALEAASALAQPSGPQAP